MPDFRALGLFDGKATPLHLACANNWIDRVAVHLEEGKIDVNVTEQYGRTPMMHAALHGRTKVVEMLLNAGADPKIKSREGFTAKDYAEREGMVDIVNLLKAI